MILDTLDNRKRYAGLNPSFEEAFEFLARADLRELTPGRHEIDGDKVFAIVVSEQGKGRDGATLEAHRNYTDIQYCVSGLEEMGWKPVSDCADDEGFDEAKDLGFFADEPTSWVTVPAGMFAIFFPEDAHAVLGGTGDLRKVVVKVAEGQA